ncbi:MAG: MFS transporter [Pseudomonadota bacterium]
MVTRKITPFLSLLFVGTLCGSMIVPFMGYFIVEGLGREPWTISLYAGSVALIVVMINRHFARRMDGGARPFPLIGVAVGGSVVASTALVVAPGFWTVMTFGVPGFSASASALATMFTLGGVIAGTTGIKRTTFNAYMRATTSFAWMIGPAVSFVVADQFGFRAVFALTLALAILWGSVWIGAAPRDAVRQAAPSATEGGAGVQGAGIWIAAAFVFGLSAAHFMTFTALPLFFVQEVGLPAYAPGNAFTVKTFVEILAIFTTPVLISRFGIRNSLVATALLAVLAIRYLASVESYTEMLLGAALEGLYYGLFSTLGISFVQSLGQDRPAAATAVYWNTLMLTGLLGGPAAGLIAQAHDFQTVILWASGVALASVIILVAGMRHPSLRVSSSV